MKTLMVVGSLGMLFFLGGLRQDPEPRRDSAASAEQSQNRVEQRSRRTTVAPSSQEVWAADAVRPPVPFESASRLRRAIEDYKQAEDDRARDEAVQTIREELSKQYDAFLDRQQSEIEKLESRLDDLRDQLQRRREAKSKMLELKLELELSRADGLGWPDQPPGNFVGPHPIDDFFGEGGTRLFYTQPARPSESAPPAIQRERGGPPGADRQPQPESPPGAPPRRRDREMR